jgi:hypothetical protein
MAQEWLEVLAKRNRTSKTRRLHIDGAPTNQFSWDGQVATPVHYKDAGGQWQNISTVLVPSTRSITGFGNPAYEMVENEYELFVLGTLSSGVPTVRYVSKNTLYWVQFAAHNLQWTNDLNQISAIATPVNTATQVSGAEARWPNTYGAGRSLRYTAGPGRMGKWLDIASALPAPPAFIISGGNPVIEFAEILEFHADLSVWVNGALWNKSTEINTATKVEFRSPDGQVQFVFPVAMAYHEGTENASITGRLYLKKTGPRLYVTVRFPWTWLQTATYPIHLDTTVDKQVAASTDDGYWASYGIYPTSNILEVGNSGGQTHGWYRWTNITIPNASTINVSYITLYEEYGTTYSGITTLVYCNNINTAVAPTTVAEANALALTTNNTSWGITETWNMYTAHNSPSINSAVQEVVNRAGWASGNALMVVHKDNGSPPDKHLHICTWNFYTLYAPKLHIEYTAGAAVVEGAAAGSGIGIGVAVSILEILAQAQASGIGLGTATPLLEILAGAAGNGIGIGSATGTLEILGQAQASGIGIGSSDAVLEILAQASGQGMGLATAQGMLEILAVAQASGIGIGAADALVEILAAALGSSVGTALLMAPYILSPMVFGPGMFSVSDCGGIATSAHIRLGGDGGIHILPDIPLEDSGIEYTDFPTKGR